MTSKSKNKGNTFEREVAKYLSDLYSAPFNRVITSGAYVGGKNAIRKETLSEGQIRSHKGDIVPPDSWKRFNAEAKSYAEFTFHRLLSNVEIPLLETWIGQSLDAADEGDFTIIFMKFNRIGRYVCYRQTDDMKANRFVDYTSSKYGTWRITNFDEFFDLNKDTVKKICES
jgi:hypothetical protein